MAVACIGCDPIAVTTFEPGVEHLPMPGSFHVEGEPPRAGQALAVRFIGSDGELADHGEDFAVGDLIRIDRTNYPGEHGLMVNRVPCDGRFKVEAGRETDVILRITDQGCETTVARTHDEGAVVHEETTSFVIGIAPIAATIDVVSIDDPPTQEPVVVVADESGSFGLDSLAPGRYRLTVRPDGTIPSTVTIDLRPGETGFVDLTASPSSPP